MKKIRKKTRKYKKNHKKLRGGEEKIQFSRFGRSGGLGGGRAREN